MWFMTRRKIKLLNKEFIFTVNSLKDILIKKQVSQEDLRELHLLLVKIYFNIAGSDVKNIFIKKVFNPFFDCQFDFNKTTSDVIMLKYCLYELVEEGKFDYSHKEIDEIISNILTNSIDDILEGQSNNNYQENLLNLYEYIKTILQEMMLLIMHSYPEANSGIYDIIKVTYPEIMNYDNELRDYLINDYFGFNTEDFSEYAYKRIIIAYCFDLINDNNEGVNLSENDLNEYLNKVEMLWINRFEEILT